MLKLLSKIVGRYSELKYALLEAQTYDTKHFGFPEVYYEIMETDAVRVNAFRHSFAKHGNLKDKVVCEVGVGRLALSRFFLPHVKKAYLIESNPKLIGFIQNALKKNGWEEKVVFIPADALTVQLPEKVDFIIGENMSIFCANEHQVQIFAHLRQFLKPEGKLIPEKIINLIQLGKADFEENINHYPILFSRHLPTVMTTQREVNTIDLYTVKDEPMVKTIRVEARLSGEVNCVYLNSWVQCVKGVNFTGTDSLMPPTVVKLKMPAHVEAGETLQLKVKFSYGTSLDEAVFWISTP